MKRTILGLVVFALLIFFSAHAWPLDRVSHRTGRLTVTQTDHYLSTPIGRIPITRTYQAGLENGVMGPGWSLAVASRLEHLTDDLLLFLQGMQMSLLVRASSAEVYETTDGIRARKDGQRWIVTAPNGKTSTYDQEGKEVSRSDLSGNSIAFAYDAQGRLSQIQAAKGERLNLTYDENGLLTAIQAPSGRRSNYHYDPAGRLTEARDVDGWKTGYRYKADGKLSTIHYPSGEEVDFGYDAAGRVAQRNASSGAKHSYSYDDRAARITRQDGYWWEMGYDAKGFPVGYRDSLKREQTWLWDDEGRLVGRRFPDGSSATYTYDGQERLVRGETGRGDVLRVSYDGSSPRPTQIDFNGAVTRFAYDDKGNLLSVTTPGGRQTTYAYDGHGRRTSSMDGEGRITRFEYDVQGNLVKQIDPAGGVTSWAYDAQGRVMRECDPEGSVTGYTYQSNGLLASIAGPGRERISYQYDPQGRLVVEAIGAETTRYRYDERGLPVRIDYPDQTHETFAYDALGNPETITDALGRVTHLEFDALGRLEKATLPSGLVVTTEFRATGRDRAVTVGESVTRIASKDGGRLIRLRDPAGAETRLMRDRWGRVIQRVFPGGGREQRQYDPDGFLESVSLPMGDAWRFTLDAAGQLSEVSFPGGAREKLAYDKAGQLASISYPWGKAVQYRYDARGVPVATVNARGQEIRYTYDQSGRLIRKQTPDDTWTYRYDLRGNLLQATNGRFTERHTYDDLGRLVQSEYPEWGKTIGYRYDPYGRIIERTDPDGNQTRYAYDKLGRISRIVAPGGRAFDFTYDEADRLLRRKVPNGTTSEYAYDLAGRVVSITHRDASSKVLAARTYSYDVDGNRVAVRDAQGQERRYRYDPERRLIGESGPYGPKTYVYGPGGDRASISDASGSQPYRYDEGGRLLQAGEASFSYDDDGNLISRKDKEGITRYAYDAEGNLTEVELANGQTMTYGYGPFGGRVWREQEGQRIYYLFEGDDLLQELSEKFEAQATYLYAGLDLPLMVLVNDGEEGFFHQDLLGSVLAVSDGQGRVSARYGYDAFGNMVGEEGQAPGRPLRFTGRPLDPATGLYDLRARFYDPTVGRFISPDPEWGHAEDPVSLALYIYARNNPLTYVDSFGRQAWEHPQWFGQRGPMFLRPKIMEIMSKLNARDLEYLAEEYGYLLKDYPQEAGPYLDQFRQRLLRTMPKTPEPGSFSRALEWAEHQAVRMKIRVLGTARSPTIVQGPVTPPGAGGGGILSGLRTIGSRIGAAANRAGSILRSIGAKVEAAAQPYVPGAQELLGQASTWLLRMRLAEIAGEASASYFFDSTDDAKEVLKDHALEFGLYAVAQRVAAPLVTKLAAAAPATVTVGAAATSGVVLTGWSLYNTARAYQEARGYYSATVQLAQIEKDAVKTEALFEKKRGAMLTALNTKLDRLTELRGILARLVKEVDFKELEIQVANDRNAKGDVERGARDLQADIQQLGGKVDRLHASIMKDFPMLDPKLGAPPIQAIKELEARACAPKTSPAEARAAAAEAARRAQKFSTILYQAKKTIISTDVKVTAEMAGNIATQVKALKEKGGSMTAIEERMKLIGEGSMDYIEALIVAETLQEEILARVTSLQYVTQDKTLAADLAAIGKAASEVLLKEGMLDAEGMNTLRNTATENAEEAQELFDSYDAILREAEGIAEEVNKWNERRKWLESLAEEAHSMAKEARKCAERKAKAEALGGYGLREHLRPPPRPPRKEPPKEPPVVPTAPPSTVKGKEVGGRGGYIDE